ncbi:MAG: SBBP repeat-containing protein [Cyclobacteriaceae bacterium]
MPHWSRNSIIVSLLFLSFSLTAQKPRIVWSTYFSGANGVTSIGNDLALDKKGNVYMAATTDSKDLGYNGFNGPNPGLTDPILVKFDSLGNRVWATYFGFSVYDDTGESVAIDDSGNVYFAGVFNGTTSFLAKISPSCKLIWSKSFSGDFKTQVKAITVDAYGNIFLTGSTWSASGIAQDGHDNTYGTDGTFTGNSDAFLLKFNSAGDLKWGTYCGGFFQDDGKDVITDSYGNVYIIGTTYSDSGIAANGFDNVGDPQYGDAFIVKYDSEGALIWGTYFGGAGEDQGLSIALDTQGDFFYAGGRTLGSPNLAYHGYDSTIGNYDAWLAKFTLDGNRVWSTYYGSSESPVIYDQCNSLAVDESGNIYMAGLTLSTTEIAFGGFDTTYNGRFDAFMVKFSGGGKPVWGSYFGGPGDDVSNAVVAGNGKVFMTGSAMSDTLSYQGFDNTYNGSIDAYLIDVTEKPIITNITEELQLQIFPNPSSGNFSIQFNSQCENTNVQLINELGQNIPITERKFVYKIEISSDGNSPGIYFAKINTQKGPIFRKVVIK